MQINYYKFVFFLLIIAPFFEELIFRGCFTKISYFKVIPYLGILVYIYLTNNHYLFVFYIILVIILLFIKNKEFIIYIINSLIFSLVHYNITDFESINNIIPMFLQFSLGLIFIWIVLNYNILRSIFFHFLYNLILVIIFTIPLQTPKKETNEIIYIGYKFQWSKTPILTSKNSSISMPNKYEINADNIDLNSFYHIFENKSKKIKIKEDNLFYKFNFKLKKNDPSANELDDKTVKKILTKASLIEKTD